MLKLILLVERNQLKKAKYCMILTIWHSGKSKTMQTVNKKITDCRGQEGERDQIFEHINFFRVVKLLCMFP